MLPAFIFLSFLLAANAYLVQIAFVNINTPFSLIRMIPLGAEPVAQCAVLRLVDQLVIATNGDLSPNLRTHCCPNEREAANDGIQEKPVAISILSS